MVLARIARRRVRYHNFCDALCHAILQNDECRHRFLRSRAYFTQRDDSENTLRRISVLQGRDERGNGPRPYSAQCSCGGVPYHPIFIVETINLTLHIRVNRLAAPSHDEASQQDNRNETNGQVVFSGWEPWRSTSVTRSGLVASTVVMESPAFHGKRVESATDVTSGTSTSSTRRSRRGWHDT